MKKPLSEAKGSAQNSEYNENEEELSEVEEELHVYDAEDETVESGSVYDTTETET